MYVNETSVIYNEVNSKYKVSFVFFLLYPAVSSSGLLGMYSPLFLHTLSYLSRPVSLFVAVYLKDRHGYLRKQKKQDKIVSCQSLQVIWDLPSQLGRPSGVVRGGTAETHESGYEPDSSPHRV